MSISKRRATCSACRAFDCTSAKHGGGCTLFYNTKQVRASLHFNLFAPDEPCPRPLTYKSLFLAKKKGQP